MQAAKGFARDFAPARELYSSLPTAADGEWFILRTRSRHERIVASKLRAREIGNFLPLRTVERMYCDQRVVVEVPLFPGVVFLRGRREDIGRAGCSDRVIEVIEVSDQEQIDAELSAIARVLACNARLDQHPYLQSAPWVEVQSGVLAGLQAVVANRLQPNPLVLQISCLRQAVCLYAQDAMVRYWD